LLDTLIQRHAAKPSAKPAPAQRPAVAQRSADGTKVARALERHLQTAILDPAARERLVRDAMRLTGGDRSAAIRVVLHDLLAEDRRFS
jgi:DNA-binding TFAR19-related protein (PDSD5 family)